MKEKLMLRGQSMNLKTVAQEAGPFLSADDRKFHDWLLPLDPL